MTVENKQTKWYLRDLKMHRYSTLPNNCTNTAIFGYRSVSNATSLYYCTAYWVQTLHEFAFKFFYHSPIHIEMLYWNVIFHIYSFLRSLENILFNCCCFIRLQIFDLKKLSDPLCTVFAWCYRTHRGCWSSDWWLWNWKGSRRGLYFTMTSIFNFCRKIMKAFNYEC